MSRHDYEEDYGYGMDPFAMMPYGGQGRRRRPRPPRIVMDTERKLWKYVLFGVLTGGIYSAYMLYRMQVDLNIMESRHDGERTMSYFLMMALSTLTLGISVFVWQHKFCDRIGKALKRRNIDYKFSSGTFWGWGIVGILLFGLGPWIFYYKLIKSMNYISEDFNEFS